MSPGRSFSQLTGLGLEDTESSNRGAWNCFDEGGVPPVARATAHCTARRALSFPVATVVSLKSGFLALFSSKKHDRTLPSEVASAGMERPLFWNSGSAPT